jgi:hypothetical protein
MKADLSRATFDKARRYRSVRMQQGRVQLDADFNEQQDILNHRIEIETRDSLGPVAVPIDNPGFRPDPGRHRSEHLGRAPLRRWPALRKPGRHHRRQPARSARHRLAGPAGRRFALAAAARRRHGGEHHRRRRFQRRQRGGAGRRHLPRLSRSLAAPPEPARSAGGRHQHARSGARRARHLHP